MKRIIFMAISAMAIAGMALVRSEVTARPLDPMAQANVDALTAAVEPRSNIIMAQCDGAAIDCKLMCASCGKMYNSGFGGGATAVYEPCHECGGTIFYIYGDIFIHVKE